MRILLVYNILTIGAPVLYIGPEPSHLSEILPSIGDAAHTAAAAHGNPALATDQIRRLAVLGTRGDPEKFSRTAARFAMGKLRSAQIELLEKSMNA